MSINIQLYQQVKDTTGTEITVAEVIEIIAGRVGASANIEQRVINIRKFKEAIAALKKNKAEDPECKKGEWDKWLKERTESYDQLKAGLPAVTWSGTFKKRSAKYLEKYSQLICLDIDNVENVKELFEKICALPFTYIAFISPSGNGIKAIFKVAGTADQHKDYFISIEKYFLDIAGIAIDPSGKDVSRLCFLTIHTKIFTNFDAETYTLPATTALTEPEIKKLSTITANEKKTLQTSGQQCNDIFDSTQQYFSYTEGNRNNFVFKYACNCNRVGISATECEQFALSFATDMKADQVKATVNSAYKANSNEYGKFKKQTAPTGGTKKIIKADIKRNTLEHEGIQPDFIFWKEQKFKKGKGESAYEIVNYKLIRRSFRIFLFANGFHLLPGEKKSFQMVHSSKGIIRPVETMDIKHFCLNWCEEMELHEINEMLSTGQTKYFAKNELDSLPYKEVPIRRDTAEETYFYFNNAYVVVNTKGEIIPKDYSTLDGYIWESNKIKNDYKDVPLSIINSKDELLPYDEINCEFAKFIAYVSYNPNYDEEKHFNSKQITHRFLSFCAAIGWLLDGYKHPSNRTAIFAIDHKIGERNEANGRTGKSLIPQACELLKNVSHISGKDYDPKYQFKDEPITVDSQIINFNDMQRNFDVETIFEKIADNYSVNRRNQGFIHFKYINSPKVYYSTNFIPKGEGSSYKSRMTVLEFSDYFSDTHKPYDEFGHGFFDEGWNKEEWERFYCFMVWCVAYYKENGLQDYLLPNIEARKLVNDVVPEFIDFMEDHSEVPKNTRLVKIDLMEKYNVIHMRFYSKKITPHSFTSWIKKFCTTKGYRLNPKQHGKFDKSNSVEYITIADTSFNNEQTKLL